MMVNGFKKFFATFVLFAFIAAPVLAEELYAQTAQRLQKCVIENPKSAGDLNAYVKFLSKRANHYYYFKKDYENAADDLRAILFLKKNSKGSSEYATYLERLNKALSKMCFDNANANRLEIAKNLYLECKYFASAYEFTSLLEKNYETGVCYEYLGDISQKFKNPKDALAYYLKAFESDNQNPRLNFKMAKLYDEFNQRELAQDKYSDAIATAADEETLRAIVSIYSAKLAREPQNPVYYETLGKAYQELGEYEKTYPLYRKAIELNPSDIFLKYSYASLLHEMEQFTQAIEVYDSILKNNPYESQIRIGKAKCLAASQKPQLAIKEYQIVLAIYPDSMSAKYGIYKILYPRMGIAGSVANFYPLNENFVPSSNFYLDFARFLDKKGEYKEAIEAYRLSIEKNKSNAKAYLELYDLYLTRNNEAKAHEVAQQAYEQLPGNNEIRKIYSATNKDNIQKKNSLALSYIQNKEYGKAIMIYEQVTPKTSAIYESIAVCYRMAKNYDKAAAYLNSALQLDPTNSDLHYSLALVYIDKKDFVMAETHLAKAIGLDKNNIKAVKLQNYVAQRNIADALNKAYALYEKKEYDKAHIVLNDAMKKYDKNAQLYYYKGFIYEAQEKYPEAMSNYQNALKIDRNLDIAYFSIAQILEKYGKGKEALEAYERFLGGDSTDKAAIDKAQKRVIDLSKRYY